MQQYDEPEPTHLESRQVLVRLRASSINYRDLLGVKGLLQRTPPGMTSNHIPLCDGAGEVVATGSKVTRVKTGDRVALTFHSRWIGGSIPHDLNILGRSSAYDDGTLAELTLVDESEVVHVPPHLSYEEAATLACAGVTAWYALNGAASLLPGEDVLVMGTGGVSIFALQIAKAGGARVIATTTSPSKTERLRELGADVVIDASDGADWSSQVVAATAGRGVDVTVEVGGPATWKQSILATRRSGRMSLVGALGGGSDGMPASFMMRGIHMHPTRVGSREHFEQMNRAFNVNGIRPIIERVFEFDDVIPAFEYFSMGSRIGKIVIRHT